MDTFNAIFQGTARAGTKISLASKLFNSAILYTNQLEEYEGLSTESFKEVEALYDTHSISVIIMCASALEAKINQFYEKDCYQTGKVKDMLKILKNQKYLCSANVGIFDKYKNILQLINNQVLQDDKHWSIQSLVILRNAIVHYNPEVHFENHSPVSMKIYNQSNTYFETKRGLFDKNLPYFPSQCLGFGAAKWAVVTTFLFWEKFFELTGVQQEIGFYQSEKYKIQDWL